MKGTFSFPTGRFVKNCIIFGAGISSSGLDDTKLTAGKKVFTYFY